MKILNLSLILAVLLSGSTSAVLAMEAEYSGETEKKVSLLKVPNKQQADENKHVFDFWALNEICVNQELPEDIMKHLRKTTAVFFLPEFPIDKNGNTIDIRNYSISGKNLKLLIEHDRTYIPSMRTKSGLLEIVDPRPYHGFRVTALGKMSDYSQIKDSNYYDVLYDECSKCWCIKGNIDVLLTSVPISDDGAFTVQITQFYDPYFIKHRLPGR